MLSNRTCIYVLHIRLLIKYIERKPPSIYFDLTDKYGTYTSQICGANRTTVTPQQKMLAKETES